MKSSPSFNETLQEMEEEDEHEDEDDEQHINHILNNCIEKPMIPEGDFIDQLFYQLLLHLSLYHYYY